MQFVWRICTPHCVVQLVVLKSDERTQGGRITDKLVIRGVRHHNGDHPGFQQGICHRLKIVGNMNGAGDTCLGRNHGA